MIHIVPDFLVEIPILRFYRKLIDTFRISFCSLMFLCSVFFVLFYHFLLYLISYRSVLCWSSAGTKRRQEVSLLLFQMVCHYSEGDDLMVHSETVCNCAWMKSRLVFCVQMIWSVVILLASALSVGEYLHIFPTVWEVKITCDRLLWKTVVVRGQTQLKRLLDYRMTELETRLICNPDTSSLLGRWFISIIIHCIDFLPQTGIQGIISSFESTKVADIGIGYIVDLRVITFTQFTNLVLRFIFFFL